MKKIKECGHCTLCCTILDVAELNKPAGVSCEHLKKFGGCGCSLHGQTPDPRPAICGAFKCAWLADEEAAIPSRFRPDRCGVILTENHSASKINGVPTLNAICRSSEDYRREEAQELIRRLLALGFVVLVKESPGPSGATHTFAPTNEAANRLRKSAPILPFETNLV